VVIGAGDATGGAIAKAFAREGLTACVVRRPRHLDQLEGLADSIRDEGGKAAAFGVDAREEEGMSALFDTIEADIGPVEVGSLISAPTSVSRSKRRPRAPIARFGKWRLLRASSRGGRRPSA
jgi:NAD(P)-dependent dehydrogenase (short-subunit alcohol dehydrogenase family)